jgi:hypothetical protein
VIIYDLDIVSIAVLEPETNAPRPIDSDRPLAFSVSLEWVQPHALQRADVIQSTGSMHNSQQLQRGLGIKPTTARSAGPE